jgi:hypothetical protein
MLRRRSGCRNAGPKSVRLRGTLRAETLQRDIRVAYDEAGRQIPGPIEGHFNIENRTTGLALKMAVLPQICTVARRRPIQVHLLYEAPTH